MGKIPEIGATIEIANGMHWLRMPLPFSLNHINLWLLEDCTGNSDGWTVVDTGLGDDKSKAIWKNVFSGFMGGAAIQRVIATHMHPDHVGCAGWLADYFDVDLWMTHEEYTICRLLVGDTGKHAPDAAIEFYQAAGFAHEALDSYRKIFGFFGKYVTPLPESYRRLSDGQQLRIGNHEWEVVIGSGHSPEHACFYNEELNLFISGDQVLPTISSNVSVYPTEPDANPLQDWLGSLAAIKDRIPADVLVLPAHGEAFRGAHERIGELIAGHMTLLEALFEFCAKPRRTIDVFPALYRRKITSDNLMFATGEAIAHLNFLIAEGRIEAEPDAKNVLWYRQK